MNKTLQAISKLYSIEHHFGSSYHPEANWPIETSHKIVNDTLRICTKAHPKRWGRYVKIAQWIWRSTPRPELNDRSPFEVVTGLKPQGPMER